MNKALAQTEKDLGKLIRRLVRKNSKLVAQDGPLAEAYQALVNAHTAIRLHQEEN